MCTIGILQCDHVSDAFRSDFDDYSEMFKSLFLSVSPSLSFKFYPVIDDIFPASTDECDAWLITGSRHDSYSDQEWIIKLGELIKQLHKEKRQLVGICFGHHLIAHKLGGLTQRSDKGWGVGVHSWTFYDQPDWLDQPETDFSMIVSHQDQIQKLPPEAKLIAGSEFCEVGAFQIGEHILCFQGHPEFIKQYSHDLMMSRTDRIPADQLEKGLASLKAKPEPRSRDVTQWIINFIQQQ